MNNERLVVENEEQENENQEIIEEEFQSENKINKKKIKKGNLKIVNKKKGNLKKDDSDSEEHAGKKSMEFILLNLNSYWLSLIGTISLIMSLVVYEIIGFLIIINLFPLFEFELNFEALITTFKFLFQSLGLKWFFFITMNQHLSIGFFCLTTFSDIFQETKDLIYFYGATLIKVILYYNFSAVVLKVFIQDLLGNYFITKIKETGTTNPRVYEVFDDLIDELSLFIADFLSSFNVFLDKLIIGSMYVFLFHKPQSFSDNKIIYFRLLSLIPILFIIVSIILRELHNTEVIKINVYILPLLLGSKIVIYLFFIITLLIIKYYSLKYKVFDKRKYIKPTVFTSIGSKIFGVLGLIELFIGLFFPSCSLVGIGGKYLLILCAPIMALYDYKKKYHLKFCCCKKGDFSKCIKITIYVIGYLIVIILGLVLLILFFAVFDQYLKPLLEFIITNIDLIVSIVDLIME